MGEHKLPYLLTYLLTYLLWALLFSDISYRHGSVLFTYHNYAVGHELTSRGRAGHPVKAVTRLYRRRRLDSEAPVGRKILSTPITWLWDGKWYTVHLQWLCH